MTSAARRKNAESMLEEMGVGENLGTPRKPGNEIGELGNKNTK